MLYIYNYYFPFRFMPTF